MYIRYMSQKASTLERGLAHGAFLALAMRAPGGVGRWLSLCAKARVPGRFVAFLEGLQGGRVFAPPMSNSIRLLGG